MSTADLWGWVVQLLDVLVVAGIIYSLVMLARGTRAWKIISGLAVFGVIYVLSDVFHFRTLNWLLRQIVPLAPVALVILFYPELRFALEEVGRVQFWQNRLHLLPREQVERVVGELVRLAGALSEKHVGALLVIEREERLDEFMTTGVEVDAHVSVELLSTLFHPGTALHDGAVIVRGDRVVAAGCVLPLTERPGIGTEIHTRHRAAIGMSERSDAVVLVVSEETGAISIGLAGHLERGMQREALQARLLALLRPPDDGESRLPLPVELLRRSLTKKRFPGG